MLMSKYIHLRMCSVLFYMCLRKKESPGKAMLYKAKQANHPPAYSEKMWLKALTGSQILLAKTQHFLLPCAAYLIRVVGMGTQTVRTHTVWMLL